MFFFLWFCYGLCFLWQCSSFKVTKHLVIYWPLVSYMWEWTYWSSALDTVHTLELYRLLFMPCFISLNIASVEATWNYSWGRKITQLNSFLCYGWFVLWANMPVRILFLFPIQHLSLFWFTGKSFPEESL